jgi:uncharacterized protein (DUF2267 family)
MRGASLARGAIMPLRTELLASHVAAHAGVSQPLAEHALREVVTGAGAYLTRSSRQLIAEELPAELGEALEAGAADKTPIEERVQVPGLTAGEHRELVASVCRVLAEELSNEAIDALTRSLPPGIAKLLVPSSPDVPRASTLHRHSASVAHPNPHGETKLSSTEGTTQEREHETLAEGHPGPRRTLSDPG